VNPYACPSSHLEKVPLHSAITGASHSKEPINKCWRRQKCCCNGTIINWRLYERHTTALWRDDYSPTYVSVFLVVCLLLAFTYMRLPSSVLHSLPISLLHLTIKVQVNLVDHRKRRSSTVALVHFCRNIFTKPLPSNKLFRLSGVMSQYVNWFLTTLIFS
jgi:hypothetical protein